MPAAPVHDMNCEWVERHLSAYHDNVLDADTTARIQSHVATCDRCETVLNDYVRFDQLVAELPRVAPADHLRERIFASAEFHAILQGEEAAGDEKPEEVVVAPKHTTARLMRQIAQVAAAVIFIAGVGYAVKTLAASPARSTTPAFVACPHIAAGPSGTRLVYRNARTQTLYSDSARLNCDRHITAGAHWQVSPDGHWIAYTDATSGRLRLVSSDAGDDHAIDTGAGAVVALSWSPDSQRLAIVKFDAGRSGAGGTSYRMLVAQPGDATAITSATFQAQRLTYGPVWSPDGQSAAWAYTPVPSATTEAGTTSIGVIAVSPNNLTTTVSVAGDVLDMSLYSSTQPANALTYLTAISGYNGVATEMETYSISSGGAESVRSLSFSATGVANFGDATRQWALAQNDGTVVSVDALTGVQTPLAHIDGVTRLRWSPSGKYLAVTSGTTLWLLTTTGAQRFTTALGAATPVWGQDDSHLAYVANGAVLIADATTGQTSVASTGPKGAISGLVWGPENTLAVWGLQGVAFGATAINAPLAEAPQWSVSQ